MHMEDKEIHFNPKHVDESWKEQISKEKSAPHATQKGSPHFLTLVNSLGMQALMALGLLDEGRGGLKEPDPAAAKEMIDLLAMVKEKTEGNLTAEENRLITSLISDLQLKFVQLQRK